MKHRVPYSELTFDKFRQLATSNELTHHEMVGFPVEYRQGKEEAIFTDVRSKLRALQARDKIILEIGPGCSRLPIMLSELCHDKGHQLHFVDSQEMLDHLPNDKHIRKWAGRYPDDVESMITGLYGNVDAVIAYSVIQYVFAEGNIWDFLDKTLSLLADGGEILLADIPNLAMRKRFFSSNAGIEHHRAFTGTEEPPEVRFNLLEPGHIDDSVVLALLARARTQGFNAWAVPQPEDLPMANRREDILIRKP